MSEFTEPENGPPSVCPRCGEPLAQVRTSEFDEVGPRRVDFECPNRHQIVVHRVEIDDAGVLDDVDADSAV